MLCWNWIQDFIHAWQLLNHKAISPFRCIINKHTGLLFSIQCICSVAWRMRRVLLVLWVLIFFYLERGHTSQNNTKSFIVCFVRLIGWLAFLEMIGDHVVPEILTSVSHIQGKHLYLCIIFLVSIIWNPLFYQFDPVFS